MSRSRKTRTADPIAYSVVRLAGDFGELLLRDLSRDRHVAVLHDDFLPVLAEDQLHEFRHERIERLALGLLI